MRDDDADLALFGAVLDGVLDEILEDLTDPARVVAADYRCVGHDRDLAPLIAVAASDVARELDKVYRLTLANELARLPIDVLVTQGYATRTVVKAINSIPIVYVFSADPILAGIARSLARPGGNATGISLLSVELNGKRIELLREMLPQLQRVTVIANPAHSGANFELEACNNAGRQLGIAVRQALVRNPAELEESFAEIAAGKPGAITVVPDGLVIQKRQRIVDFAAGERIPVISGWKIFAESGALCTYGPRLTESYRRAGYYIDRILKGMNPAELPIERPTVFELVVNLKAAKTLDVTLPPSVLARADEVIE